MPPRKREIKSNKELELAKSILAKAALFYEVKPEYALVYKQFVRKDMKPERLQKYIVNMKRLFRVVGKQPRLVSVLKPRRLQAPKILRMGMLKKRFRVNNRQMLYIMFGDAPVREEDMAMWAERIRETWGKGKFRYMP